VSWAGRALLVKQLEHLGKRNLPQAQLHRQSTRLSSPGVPSHSDRTPYPLHTLPGADRSATHGAGTLLEPGTARSREAARTEGQLARRNQWQHCSTSICSGPLLPWPCCLLWCELAILTLFKPMQQHSSAEFILNIFFCKKYTNSRLAGLNWPISPFQTLAYCTHKSVYTI